MEYNCKREGKNILLLALSYYDIGRILVKTSEKQSGECTAGASQENAGGKPGEREETQSGANAEKGFDERIRDEIRRFQILEKDFMEKRDGKEFVWNHRDDPSWQNMNFYRDREGDGCANIFGYQTNEAGTKAILNRCDGSMDIMILLATESVLNPPNKDRHKKAAGTAGRGYTDYLEPAGDGRMGEGSVLWRLNLRSGSGGEMIINNTFDFYINQMFHYISCMGYDKRPDIYVLKLKDDPDDEEVNNCCITAARLLMEKWSEGDKLYLETNGGPRDTMMVLTGTLRAIAHYRIVPEYAAYSTFVNGQGSEFEKPIKITNKINSYRFFDLVSGLDDFLATGNSERLIRYFKENPGIDGEGKLFDLLSSVEELSHAFLICKPGDMINTVVNTASALEKVKDLKGLQGYVAEEIRKNFGEELLTCACDEGKKAYALVSIMEWALKKRYVQQTITLFAEKVPDLLVGKKILYYKEGSKIAEKLKEAERKEGYSEAYRFIQQYLCVEPKKDEVKEENTSKENEASSRNETVEYKKSSSGKKKSEYKNRCYQALIGEKVKWKRIDGTDCYSWKACSNVNFIRRCLDCSVIPESQKIYSEFDKEEAIELLREYYSVKELRNAINHADTSSKDRFTSIYVNYNRYDRLARYLQYCIADLKKAVTYMDDGKSKECHIEPMNEKMQRLAEM